MKIQKYYFAILSILMLLIPAPLSAAKGGQGGGKPGGGGDGGGGTCEATSGVPALATLIDTSDAEPQPIVGTLNFDGYRIGSRAMDAVSRGSDVLVAVSSSSTPNVDTSVNRVLVFTFTPGTSGTPGSWNFLQEIALGSGNGDYDLDTNDGMKLIDWDGNGLYDIVIASISTDQAAIIWDVDGVSPSVDPLPVPADALTFGRSVGFGDVDGDGVGEVLVGDVGSDAVYVYHSSDALPDRLSSPEGGDFGQSIAVGPDGLYVGADAVNASSKQRGAGGVYHYPLPLSCFGGKPPYTCTPSTSPGFVTRAIKNENLGHRLTLANSSDVVTTPAINGNSIAVFPYGSTPSLNLPVPDFGMMDNVSAGDLDFFGSDEIATGTSNAGADSGQCYNVGAVTLFVDRDETTPIVLRSNDVIDKDNLFFGRSTAIAGGYLFVGEMGRDIDGKGTDDGQIYVFSLP
ncbi:MAG: VCBS repeat-containing protein [Acidobacteriota bacterium]|nr:MAG: VCBS repeat-containing protein [Acidobacteriota bacterium]